MKTEAAVVYAHNQPVTIETLDLEEPRSKEVRVRIVASGVCHSDLSVVNGTIHYDPPVVLGHEGAGIVDAIGDDVTYVSPGDHVVLSFVTYCGTCELCRMGKPTLCQGVSARPGHLLDDSCRFTNGAGVPIPQMARIGTMSRWTVVSEQALIKIDPNYPLEKAVLVGCGVPTGVGAVINTAQIEPGSRVAVIGAGGVGLNAIQGARLAGAGQIIAVDINDQKLEFASAFGATDAVNAAEEDPVAAVRRLTGGLGADYAFEVIGTPGTIEQAYAMIRPAGSAVIVGMAHPDSRIELSPQPLVRTEKRLVGSYYGSIVPRKDIPHLLTLYDQGEIQLDELITSTYRLDQINEAFEDLKAGRNARGVILFEQDLGD